MNKIINNKGITLVEILVAITVFSAVMIIATSMIIQSFNIINRSSEQVSRKQLAEIMLEDITNNLRQIDSVISDEDNSWEFNFLDGNANDKLKIELNDNKLEMKIDGKDIRVTKNIKNPDIEIIKDEKGNSTGRIIVEFEIEDETGRTIKKRKEILARNLN